jgi:hypothetical protein
VGRKRFDAVLMGSELAQSDWAAVLESAEGQRVLWRIITASQLLEPNGSLNSHPLMAFQEGRKALGRDVWDAIESIDPNWIPLLMQQALNEQLSKELKHDHGNGTESD